jgi:hypothetical protein
MPPARTPSTLRRYLPELVVAAVGLAVVFGIWLHNRADDGGGERATPSSEVTTTTTQPADDDAPLIQDEARSIEGDATTARSLKDAVLRAGDLGSGWSPTGQTRGPSPLCDQRDPVSGDPSAVVRSGFVRNHGTRLVAGTVAEYRSAEAAQQVLATVADQAEACSSGAVSMSVEPLPAVGQEGLRISSTVTVGSAKIRALALIARKGARVAIVTATGDPLDADLALRALQAQVGRL